MSLVYLASPYSDDDERVREARFDKACRVAKHLIGHGYNVFSPIAHSHPVATHYGSPELPKGWSFWRRIDTQFLRACDELFVLTLPGWRESEGVLAEIAAFQKFSMARYGGSGSVRYVDLDGIVTEEPRDDAA